jgi:hypothetical protein
MLAPNEDKLPFNPFEEAIKRRDARPTEPELDESWKIALFLTGMAIIGGVGHYYGVFSPEDHYFWANELLGWIKRKIWG